MKRNWLWLCAGTVVSAVAGCTCGPSNDLASCPGGCPTGQTCANGACVPGCASTSDCPSGKVCVGGTCLLSCTQSSQCGSAEQCVGDVCTPADAGLDAGRDGGSVHPDGGSSDAGHPADGGSSDAGGDAGSVCPASATLIYVVDADGGFSSFLPAPTPTFTDLGVLRCDAGAGFAPYSMSVDRNPVAWVLYANGDGSKSEIFKVDLPTLSCTPTGFQSGQQNFTTFGMGFVANDGGASPDTLYLATSLDALGNSELGSLNTSTLAVTSIASLNGYNGSAELTGTADGTLFGYFPGSNDPTTPFPPAIIPIARSDGTEGSGWPLGTLQDMPCQDPSGQCTLDYAFAFWGGDFWIFLKRSNDTATSVWKFDPSNPNDVTDVLDTTNRFIVGAGVSTCAPVTAQ